MVDREIAERAGQIGGEARILEAPAISQQIRIAEGEAGPCTFDQIVGEIGSHPRPAQIECAGDQRGAALQHAVFEREAGGERYRLAHSRGQSRHRRKAAGRTWPSTPYLPASLLIRKAGNRRSGPRPRSLAPTIAAPPPCRASAAKFRPRQCAHHYPGLKPGQPGKDATSGRQIIGLQIEPVAIRLGIEQQGDPVAARPDLPWRRSGRGLRGYRPSPEDWARSACEVATPSAITRSSITKPVHPDIEIGQQRRIGITGQQFGQTHQPPAPGGELADVEPAPQPAQKVASRARLRGWSGTRPQDRLTRTSRSNAVL